MGSLTTVWNPKALAVLAGAAVLTACGTEAPPPQAAPPNIADVADVKSSFGSDFKVESFSSGVDPAMLGQQTLPPGVVFQPADCQQYVTTSVVPTDLKGNMSAVFAEGDGNRFITIALETSAPVPVNQPTEPCQKVGFAGGSLRGLVEVVDAPQIDGASTLGTHRVYQTTIDGTLSTGELYNYIASFDTYQVIVTANPLVVPGKPATPVDTNRARDLLASAVSAVRG